MKPRCPSVGPNGYRCRRRLHGPVPADPMPADEDCHVARGWFGVDYWDDESAMQRPSQHVSVGDGEVVWDVARLVEQTAGMEAEAASVAWFLDPDVVTPAHWRTVDLHTPIIVAPHPDSGRLVCLDGRHRVYKAHRLGRVLIPAYVLSEEQERAARLSPEKVAAADEQHAAHEAWMARLGS